MIVDQLVFTAIERAAFEALNASESTDDPIEEAELTALTETLFKLYESLSIKGSTDPTPHFAKFTVKHVD